MSEIKCIEGTFMFFFYFDTLLKKDGNGEIQ